MKTEDLEIAKEILAEEGLSLCIVSNQRVMFRSSSRGITGFLSAIDKLGEQLIGAFVADKIVGKAIALLCLYARFKGVYGSIMSIGARVLLQQKAVYIEWGEEVETVSNDCEKATCPFEELALYINDPEEAYKKLKALQHSLRQADNNEQQP
jgi:hypothetical protein